MPLLVFKDEWGAEVTVVPINEERLDRAWLPSKDGAFTRRAPSRWMLMSGRSGYFISSTLDKARRRWNGFNVPKFVAEVLRMTWKIG